MAGIRFRLVKGVDPSREIVEQVRQKLQDGRLVEGDRLPTEREFAEQLGVSRNTVRKAVSGLAQLGLVTVRKGARGGAFIASPDGQTIRIAMADMFHLGSARSGDLTEARLVLGQAVVRLACARRTDDDIHLLESNVEAAERAIADGDVAGRVALNIDFYRLLAAATHNAVLTVMMDAVGQTILQFVRSAGLLPPTAVMPVRRKILEHLRTRDPEAAAAALTTHLQQLERHYLKSTAGGGHVDSRRSNRRLLTKPGGSP